jgi:hypothetical protein
MNEMPNLWPTISAPLPNARIRTVSFGAGIQSTTMLLMAAHGEIGPMPDYAIFSDTQDESDEIYEHIEFLKGPNVGLPFPILTVTAGSIRDEIMDAANGIRGAWGRPPFFILNEDGSIGMVRRQCTGDYKIDPIEREIRRLLGLRKGQHWPKTPVVESWIGISTDEIGRLSPSSHIAIHNRHPLVEVGYSRRDCVKWLRRNGYPIPPRSKCRICPYQSDAEWRRMRDTQPADWQSAIAVDRALRSGKHINLKGLLFLHRSCVPLEEADIDFNKHDRQGDWLADCSGMCGL